MSSSELDTPEPNRTSPPFHRLVAFFEKLSNLSGVGIRDRRHELINGFITKWRDQVGDDIYPAFQLILPHLDSENTRRLYNIKEHKFGKLLVAAMNLNSSSPDAKQLLEFRSVKGNSAGNFADIAFKIIDKRDTNLEFSATTIDQVLELLSKLSVGKFNDQVGILQKMIQEMNALEMKWIVKIILQSMHLHVSEHTFFYCWHPDSQALFNVTNDLKVVCHQLWDRSVRLEAKDQEIKPGNCFKPQRSKFRRHAMEQFAAIVAEMPDSGFYIEEKMDGERMQVHWCDSGNTTRYFSRKGKDYTSYYGTGRDDNKGTLSQELAAAVNPKVRECILDGEIVAYDTQNNEVCPLTKVKQAASGEGSAQWKPMFIAFDIVHLNGKNLTGVALKERKRALNTVLQNPSQSIQVLPYMLAHTEDEVRVEFERVISQLSEGLIIKNPLSKYTIDGYNNAWLKVKPEFMSGYEAENFDLIVVGGYYGRGKRGNIIASYLCAVRSENNQEFYTVCKVGNGICMAMYDKIKHLTDTKWIDFDRENIPKGVIIGGETPHKLIAPQSSIVLEVKATQIWPAEKFSSGKSLRFPRFVSLREDKSYSEALSLNQFLEVDEQQDPSKTKRQKLSQKVKNVKKARFQYEGDDTNETQIQGIFFDGIELCVAGDIRDPYHIQQPELEAMIRSYGGNITRDVNSSISKVICDQKLPRVAHIIDTGMDDVIHPRWVYDCIENRKVLPFEPDHYFYARDQSLIEAMRLVDSLGFNRNRLYRLDDTERKIAGIDPFPCTEDQLGAALKSIMSTVEDRDTRGLMFHGIVAYFDPGIDNGFVKELTRYLTFGSGRVSVFANGDLITHVICDSRENRALYARNKGPFIVETSWILNSWSEETKLDELSAGT